MTACGNFSLQYNNLHQPELHNSTAGCGEVISSGHLKELRDMKPLKITVNACGLQFITAVSKVPFYMAVCSECAVPKGRYEQYCANGKIVELNSNQASFHTPHC
jgi:hypothetical protein